MTPVTNYGMDTGMISRPASLEQVADAIREHFTEEQYRVREFQNDFMRWADDGGKGGEL
jgi:hypothetical protein